MINQLINQAKKYWIFVMLLVCPIAYGINGEQLRPFQEHFLEYMSIGFVCLFLENIWLTLFMFLNIFLYIYHGAECGSMQVLNLFFGCLVFRFSRAWFKKNKFEDCYLPIMICMILSLGFSILQKFGVDPLAVPQTAQGIAVSGPVNQTIGLFGIQMAHGIFLAMCMPIVASLNIFLAPLIFIPIYLCQSSAAILAACTATGFYIYHLYRKLFIYFIGLLILGGGLFLWHDTAQDPATMKSRFPMWSAVIKYALHYPLGYGPDSFRNYNDHKSFKFNADNKYRTMISYSPEHDDNKIYLTYYSVSNDQVMISKLNDKLAKEGFPKNQAGNPEFNMFDDPHNEYIKVLFEYGFLGVLIVIGLFWEMYDRFRFAIKTKELVVVTSCLLVFAVSSMSQFPLSIARLAIFVPFLLGGFYGVTDINGKTDTA